MTSDKKILDNESLVELNHDEFSQNNICNNEEKKNSDSESVPEKNSKEVTNEVSETLSVEKNDEKSNINFLEKIKTLQKTMSQNLKINQFDDEKIAKEVEEDFLLESKRLKSEKKEKESSEKDEIITTCNALRTLQNHLQSAPTPLLKKDYVLVHRNETLTLINTLVDLCNEEPLDPSLTGDELIDKLSSCTGNSSNASEPLSLVKKRSQEILSDAMTQADLIITDAKILSHQLLSNTEKKIQARYKEAESEINARMEITREESNKRLIEAKDSLTSARQQSEEILRKYLDKAEDDYESYWSRAEKHLEASYLKSLSILNKAVEIYKKELAALKDDMGTLENILKELESNRPDKP